MFPPPPSYYVKPFSIATGFGDLGEVDFPTPRTVASAAEEKPRVRLGIYFGRPAVVDENGTGLQYVTDPQKAELLIREWNERRGRAP